jgi:hypothetical protein
MIKVTTAYPIVVNDKYHSAEGLQVTEKLVSKKTTIINKAPQKPDEDGLIKRTYPF